MVAAQNVSSLCIAGIQETEKAKTNFQKKKRQKQNRNDKIEKLKSKTEKEIIQCNKRMKS